MSNITIVIKKRYINKETGNSQELIQVNLNQDKLLAFAERG